LSALAYEYRTGNDVGESMMPGLGFSQNTCRRIPLPTYAFQKERYWMFDPIELSVVDQSEPKEISVAPRKKRLKQKLITFQKKIFVKNFNICSQT
jgi:hypothetical protein